MLGNSILDLVLEDDIKTLQNQMEIAADDAKLEHQNNPDVCTDGCVVRLKCISPVINGVGNNPSELCPVKSYGFKVFYSLAELCLFRSTHE